MRLSRRSRRVGAGILSVGALIVCVGVLTTGRVGLQLAFVTHTPMATDAEPTHVAAAVLPTSTVATTSTWTASPPTRTATAAPTRIPTITLTAGPTDFPTVPDRRFGGSNLLTFVSERDGNPEIYTMLPDGTGLERLTFSDADDLSPRFSPDGSQIAFRANRDSVRPALYLMAVDGSRQQKVVDDGRFNEFPAWWPDGSRLIFDSDALGPYQLFILDLAGKLVTPLFAEVSAGDDAVAAVAPDGSSIAFQSRRDGVYQVYTVSATGGDLVRLTFTSARNDHPAWSPDGLSLAFVSERGGGRDLYLMNADGTDQRPLVVGQGEIRLPRFSPDGQWILFASDRDGDFDLYAVSLDGRELRRLTDDPADDYSPDWQP